MPADATIASLGAALRAGRVTAAALLEQCLAAIEERDPALNAFITVLADDARGQARAADAELSAGRDRGPLHGIPISLKDLIDLAGTPTTAASRVRSGHRATADAPVAARLRAAGAVFVGKCNLHEFALGTTGEESAYGPTRNPHAPDHVPGGSSSGSAVSVAAGMAVASIGTDTGGSIRIPASACGLVGLKPTHGEVSLEGVVPLAPSLDHVGPIARSVRDAAILHQVLSGGRGDRALPAAARGARLGVPRGYFLEAIDPAVRAVFAGCVARLESAGCRVDDVDIPHAAGTPDVYQRTQLPEAAACHRETLDAHPDDYGERVRRRLEMGRVIAAEEYDRAQQERRMLAGEVDAALVGCDALLLPTLPIVPPRLGADAETARRRMLQLTQLFDVTGHPAISVPCGMAGGLPAGVQLIGRRGRTAELLAQAAALESAVRGWQPSGEARYFAGRWRSSS